MKLFCMYIAQILFFRKMNEPMKYNVARRIYFCSTPQKIFEPLYILEQIKLLLSDFRK